MQHGGTSSERRTAVPQALRRAAGCTEGCTLNPSATDSAVVAVFATVYLGMFLGGLPGLRLDRSGVALLGAIAVIALAGLPLDAAARSIDLPTIVLLLAFMVLSAQLRMGGFYTAVAQRVGASALSRPWLLAALIALAGGLSAVFSNDVVCLAMTAVVVRLCRRRGWHPVPFLLALACAANIGSAATLIGNPQNMLIGSVLQLPFASYTRSALPAVALSLLLLWLWLAFGPGARTGAGAVWASGVAPPPAVGPAGTTHSAARAVSASAPDPLDAPRERHAGPGQQPPAGPDAEPPFDAWQTGKGLALALALMFVFLFTDWPREVAALVAAGVLLLSRRFHSAALIGHVDWPLLLLFMGLFVVNHAVERTGLATQAVAWLALQGVHLSEPGALLVLAALLSNLVSNVPAVMLLLPHLGANTLEAGTLLALASTFAGNLLLVGSIANLIVADLAAREGCALDWKTHAATGVPITLGSLLVLWAVVSP